MDNTDRLMQEVIEWMEPYPDAINCLIYFMGEARHNLARSICTLGKFIESPTKAYWKPVTRL